MSSKHSSNDELLDLVNEKDEVVGTVWRSEAHKDASKIHREIAIAVFNKDGEVLIQQRSLNKKSDPGSWKITAAGHVSAGEDPKLAAERELLEELGLKVDALFLRKEFGKRDKLPGSVESRFFYIYYSVIDETPPLVLNKKEVMNVRWIKPEDLLAFAMNNDWNVDGLSHKTIMEIYQSKFKSKT